MKTESTMQLAMYPLEVKPPFFIGGFTNHHSLSRDLSSSKMKDHLSNGG